MTNSYPSAPRSAGPPSRSAMAPCGAAPSSTDTVSGKPVAGLNIMANASPTRAASALPRETTMVVAAPRANDDPVPGSTDTGTGTRRWAPSAASAVETWARTGSGAEGRTGAHAEIAHRSASVERRRADKRCSMSTLSTLVLEWCDPGQCARCGRDKRVGRDTVLPTVMHRLTYPCCKRNLEGYLHSARQRDAVAIRGRLQLLAVKPHGPDAERCSIHPA